jgi:glyoxylase-like metal-dependent hydrolase (beta-lactamase superfamily II)
VSRRALAVCAALATAVALAAGFGALPDARAQVTSATSGDTIHVARGPARALPTYVQVTRLDDSLFVLSAGTANMVACLADSGWVLVDTGTRAEAAMLREQVRRFFDRRFDFVIDTHVHDDHAGGNALYEGMGVPVLASDRARALARTYARRVVAGAPKEIARLEACAAAQPASDTSSVRVHGFLDFMAQWWREGADDARHDPYVLAAPTLGFRGRTTHGRGSRRLEVRELPAGHTAGDCVVLFPEQRVAVVGDVFARGSVPWADQFMMGGSMEGILAAQDSLLSWIPDDTTGVGWQIIPGHGPPALRADLVANRRALGELRGCLRQAFDHGRPPATMGEDCLGAGFAADRGDYAAWLFAEDWGKPKPRVSRPIHKSLTKG